MTCVQNEAIKYKNSNLHFAPTDLTAVNSLVWSQPQDSNSNVELMILLVTTSYVKFITGKLKVLCGNNLQFSTSLSYLAAVFLQVTAVAIDLSDAVSDEISLCEGEEEQQSGNYGTLLTSTCQQRDVLQAQKICFPTCAKHYRRSRRSNANDPRL